MRGEYEKRVILTPPLPNRELVCEGGTIWWLEHKGGGTSCFKGNHSELTLCQYLRHDYIHKLTQITVGIISNTLEWEHEHKHKHSVVAEEHE